ncbi:hypothetical protein ANANG_G00104610 [Anguilla anguilla]|uniref:Uncharacterized protein n=1 Tax=Anguilla anguilla TaxID=7936 RepID=A0A9D3RZF8_ANGAN|nr:hypothetical protein ANANG_G00104610 [Anguilla anguilla]
MWDFGKPVKLLTYLRFILFLHSCDDTDTLSRSSEVKSVSPSNALEATFTRKVGAFVNKPTTQVTMASQELPFAAFAPKAFDLEENDPMVQPRSPPPPPPLAGQPALAGLQRQRRADAGRLRHGRLQACFFQGRPASHGPGNVLQRVPEPPQLASLSIDVSAQSMAEDLDSLPEKLALYEKNIDEFDAFVDTLQ